MPTAVVAYWTARVAELERELDAETKLSKMNLIVAGLMRTREALKRAKAKLGYAGRHPKRGSSRQSARRSASNVADPASA
jgi:hypothetical protein